MKESKRIFISSTWVDLQPEREAVEKALHRMQETEFFRDGIFWQPIGDAQRSQSY